MMKELKELGQADLTPCTSDPYGQVVGRPLRRRDMTETEKALQYYKCGINGIPPPFLPKRVLVLSTVRGDGPWRTTVAKPDEYECHSNKFGAVSVKASDGTMLGLKPIEFEVTEWAINPHLDRRDMRTNL